MKHSIAVFILGVLAGMIIMHTFQGKELDKLYWQNENLNVELYEMREQLKKIQQQSEALLPSVIKDIKLEIMMEDDSFVDPALKLQIYDLVKEVLGQKIQELSYPLLFNLLNGRIIEIDNKRFLLEVKAIILGETLVYYLQIRKISEQEQP